MKPWITVLLPHDVEMPKIYIIGGIIFIVIQYVQICELYYDFYLSYKNTLDNHIQCQPNFQGNVIFYLSSFIPKCYVTFCMQIN